MEITGLCTACARRGGECDCGSRPCGLDTIAEGYILSDHARRLLRAAESLEALGKPPVFADVAVAAGLTYEEGRAATDELAYCGLRRITGDLG